MDAAAATSGTASNMAIGHSEYFINVPELKSDNYNLWKERILLKLGFMDIDYAIRMDEPLAVTSDSTSEAKDLYERWERSNRLCIMFIKTYLPTSIRGHFEEHKQVKELLKALDAQYKTLNKSFASTLIMQLSTSKLTKLGGVREYIMKMRNIAAQLKNLEFEMSDAFLVHYILNGLPQVFAPYKISYNTRKEKWSLEELMAMCVQEEQRLLMEQDETMQSTHLATKEKKKAIKFKENGKIPPKTDIKKEFKCFFCKRKGHLKKDCQKFVQWLEKKGFTKSKEANGK